jgi:hypothetical protein
MKPNPCIALALFFAASAAASGQYFFDGARPRRPPQQDAAADPRGGAQDAGEAGGGGMTGFAPLAGAPQNPVIGKIVWVSQDGCHAVAWLDSPLAIPAGSKLGVREPIRLGDTALARVVQTHSRAGVQVRPLGLAVEKGAVQNGHELCVPGRGMVARLAKLPPVANPK